MVEMMECEKADLMVVMKELMKEVMKVVMMVASTDVMKAD
jgi:hypothetical protein